jgi:hypothetical protein
MIEVKKLYPHGYHKTDKLGRPIYIELISKVNLEALFKLTTGERMMNYYIKGYERLIRNRFPACSKAVGHVIEQSCTIIDVNGVGMGIMMGKTKEFLKIAANIGQNYYPEMLGSMYVINSGFFFSAVWSIAKGFIDEKTKKKINIEKNEKVLREVIDPENLPTFLGGNCKCEHVEGGCLFADIGPWNPDGEFV